jgi:CBS domain containing-hemolysin-like protein
MAPFLLQVEPERAAEHAPGVNGWLVVLGIVLVLVNGFFVAAEFGLIATRRTELAERVAERPEARNRRARAALAALSDISTMLAATQLAITITSVLLGFVAEPTIEHGLERLFDPLPHGVTRVAAIVLSLLLVTFVHTVFGEMVPKNVTLAAPSRVLLLTAVPLRWFLTVFRPVVVGLNALGRLGVRAFGVQPRDELDAVSTLDDIAAMVTESRREGVIEDFDYRLLTGALGFGELDAAAVMIPRRDVVAVPVTAPAGEVAVLVHRSGRSRLPVYDGTIDHVVGFVHAKDLLALDEDALARPVPPELVRVVLLVPETRRLPDLLVDMRRRRLHFGVVVDEHGGTAGVVSLEDVLEELVGEIRDEHDRGERNVWRVAGGRYRAVGAARLDQVAGATGLELAEGDYDTLGGFILARLGRIPEAGDAFTVDGWTLRVVAMDGLRVDVVALEAPADDRHDARE